MTKAELIKRLEGLKDEDEIAFVIFGDSDYRFRFLQPSAQMRNDPVNVLAFVKNPHMPSFETTEEVRKAISN